MDSQVRFDSGRLHVHGELTVYTCGELKPQLLEQLEQHVDATALELSQVTEIDTAGLQVLLTARRHASELGRDLEVANPSRAVTEVLALLGLDERLVSKG